MRRWLNEPLLHFFVAGALLFGIYGWLNLSDPQPGSPPRQVRIGAGEVKWLTETWVRQWGSTPTPEELRALVSSLLKEELLSREARAMGLDDGDTIVRRRLAQKLEFLLEDALRLAEPTEDDLRRLYEESAERFRTEARVSFTQVYFSRERRKDAALDARTALAKLSAGMPVGPAELGDRLLLDTEFREADARTVASAFGPEFAHEVLALRPGAWHGPIESGYGLHLVRVAEVEPSRRRELAEVRAELLDRWREARRREAEARLLSRLMQKYGVAIDESVRPLVELPGARSEPEAGR